MTTQKKSATKKAPGKHWRKGLTLVKLIRKFPDDKTAEAWFASIRWPEGRAARTATTTASNTPRPIRRCRTAAAAAGSSSP